MQGRKYFKCDECDHDWNELTRDHKSPSLSICPECNEEVIPYRNEVEIDEKDITITTFRVGSHYPMTAITVVHLPTGITATCDTERSVHKCKDIAMKELKEKLEKL